MALLKRVLRALPLLILSPFLVAISAIALLLTDTFWKLFARRVQASPNLATAVSGPRSASVVIPNWNGRDLLEKYLPSIVTALTGNPENEIVVVDNGSTDGSVEFLRTCFPQVNVQAQATNL